MRIIARRFTAVPTLCLLPLVSWAQHAVNVPVELIHASNPSLSAVSDGSVNILRVSPVYSIVKIDGAARTEISLGAVLERSSNTELSANRSDPRLGVEWQWSTQTSQWGLRGSLQDTSTRASEFDSTGRVAVDSTQRTTELGADWSQELNPVTRLSVGAVHTQVDYSTSLLDAYREASASATIERTLNDVSRISATANYGLLYPDDLQRFGKGKRSSLFFDYEVALSEPWTVGVGLGRVRTKTDVSTTSTIGRLLLVYRGDRLNSSLDWRREVAPGGSVSGYGRTDVYRWTNGYALTSETGLDLSFGRSKSLGGSGSVGRTASILLRSAWTEFWTMSMGYEMRQSTPSGGARAKGNSVSLGLTYSHPDF